MNRRLFAFWVKACGVLLLYAFSLHMNQKDKVFYLQWFSEKVCVPFPTVIQRNVCPFHKILQKNMFCLHSLTFSTSFHSATILSMTSSAVIQSISNHINLQWHHPSDHWDPAPSLTLVSQSWTVTEGWLLLRQSKFKNGASQGSLPLSHSRTIVTSEAKLGGPHPVAQSWQENSSY